MHLKVQFLELQCKVCSESLKAFVMTLRCAVLCSVSVFTVNAWCLFISIKAMAPQEQMSEKKIQVTLNK